MFLEEANCVNHCQTALLNLFCKLSAWGTKQTVFNRLRMRCLLDAYGLSLLGEQDLAGFYTVESSDLLQRHCATSMAAWPKVLVYSHCSQLQKVYLS